MICKTARYRVHAERLSEVLPAIRKFVAAVHASEPGTLHYSSFRLSETEFLHLMVFRDQQAEQHHRNSPAVQEFVGVLYPACEVEPEFQNIDLVAAHLHDSVLLEP